MTGWPWPDLEAELEFFRDYGLDAATTLEKLGVSARTAERACVRHQRSDLAAWVRLGRSSAEVAAAREWQRRSSERRSA